MTLPWAAHHWHCQNPCRVFPILGHNVAWGETRQTARGLGRSAHHQDDPSCYRIEYTGLLWIIGWCSYSQLFATFKTINKCRCFQKSCWVYMFHCALNVGQTRHSSGQAAMPNCVEWNWIQFGRVNSALSRVFSLLQFTWMNSRLLTLLLCIKSLYLAKNAL